MEETLNQQKARKLREWRRANPEKAKALKQKWIDKNRDHYLKLQRNVHMKRRYGISLSDYNNMLAIQNNSCAICLKTGGETRMDRLVVDHCHKTMKVRSLLCQSCNAVIGMSFERKEVLLGAVKYLEIHGKMQ